jgi:hypothetical protein
MVFQYKILVLSTNDCSISASELQKHFDEGWEYVDKIVQSVSGQYTHRGGVSVIIRKIKEIEF